MHKEEAGAVPIRIVDNSTVGTNRYKGASHRAPHGSKKLEQSFDASHTRQHAKVAARKSAKDRHLVQGGSVRSKAQPFNYASVAAGSDLRMVIGNGEGDARQSLPAGFASPTSGQ